MPISKVAAVKSLGFLSPTRWGWRWLGEAETEWGSARRRFHSAGGSTSETPFKPATISDNAGTNFSPWPVATAVAKPLRTAAPIGLATPVTLKRGEGSLL
jgi:hypothetical protein